MPSFLKLLAPLAFVLAGCGSSVDVFGPPAGSGGAGGSSSGNATGTTASGSGVASGVTSGTSTATTGGSTSTATAVTSSGVGGATTTSSGVVCSHGPCNYGPPLDPSCGPCVAEVCQNDPACCTSGWDDKCLSLASTFCGCPGSGVATSTGSSGCVTCAQVLSGTPGTPCPESYTLIQALVQCACVDHCGMECYGACNGMPADDICQNCVINWCSMEFNACANDL